VRDPRRIEVWRLSKKLALSVYTATEQFPTRERYELARDLRRTAVSIASNIAEGAARDSRKAFANHLDIAAGSTGELETQLDLAVALGFVDRSDGVALSEKADEVRRKIYRLMRSIRGEAARPDREA
jgi:four helix bundle protein